MHVTMFCGAVSSSLVLLSLSLSIGLRTSKAEASRATKQTKKDFSLSFSLHVLFQFLCNLQQYCDSAYNKLNSHK